MNPGPELDALVAEKVMGWRMDDNKHLNLAWDPKRSPNDGLRCIPDYSTDIAAAWEVVEKLDTLALSRGDIADISVWVAQFVTEGPGYPVNIQAIAKTPTHAICLAALKAVGVEVKEGVAA